MYSCGIMIHEVNLKGSVMLLPSVGLLREKIRAVCVLQRTSATAFPIIQQAAASPSSVHDVRDAYSVVKKGKG
jgi:hypothetical protein